MYRADADRDRSACIGVGKVWNLRPTHPGSHAGEDFARHSKREVAFPGKRNRHFQTNALLALAGALCLLRTWMATYIAGTLNVSNMMDVIFSRLILCRSRQILVSVGMRTLGFHYQHIR